MPDEPIDKDPESGADEGISRRRMLRRIGVATAVAWTTPVVTSLRTPAFAQTISAGGCSCFEDCGGPHSECSQSDCFCLTSIEGKTFCSQDFNCDDPLVKSCDTSIDCPTGWICQPAFQVGGPCTGLCGQVCVPPCGICAGPSIIGHAPIKGSGKSNRGG